jgi:hypothetical protein
MRQIKELARDLPQNRYPLLRIARETNRLSASAMSRNRHARKSIKSGGAR